MPITVAPAGALATVDNAEIGYITGISGTTITFQRAQEGTSAKSIRSGWKVYGSSTAKTLGDPEEVIMERATLTGDLDGTVETSVVMGPTLRPTATTNETLTASGVGGSTTRTTAGGCTR